MTPPQLRALQRRISGSPRAAARVLGYVEEHGGEHRGQVTGGVLAHVVGVHPRTWRKWVGGERPIPETAIRLLRLVSGV